MQAENELNHVPLELAAALKHGRALLVDNMQHVRTDAIAQIDNFVRDIQVLTRNELNHRRAASRVLPPEVLFIILGYALSEEEVITAPDETVWQGFIPISNALFTLSQVCKYWRSLLQSLASPWTVITDHESNVFIQRSKQLPVSVLIEEYHSPIVPRLPDLGPRLRELFWGPRSFEAHKIGVFAFPAPQLEVLYLNDNGGHAEADGQPSPMLFLGNIPRLRRLHLANTAWLPGNQFAVLTHLCLQTVSAPITFSAIVDLLRQCPRLEHLAFIGHMPLHSEDPAPHPLPLADDPELLPRLLRLSFDRVASKFVTTINHVLRPRRPDFVFQALQVPVDPSAVALCMCALSFLDAHPLTHLAYIRKSWHSNVSIVAVSARTAVRFSTARTHIDDTGWDPDRDTWWALAQLDRLALAMVEEFTYDFLRIRQHQCPAGTLEVFARVRRMPRLRELNVVTNDLGAFLALLYGGLLAVLGLGELRWHLPVLRITVRGHGPGEAPAVRDVFYVVDPHTRDALVIDEVFIHCDIDRRVFHRTLGTLLEMCPSVEYGPAVSMETTVVEAPPPGFVTCVDPAAHPAWDGARWDRPAI